MAKDRPDAATHGESGDGTQSPRAQQPEQKRGIQWQQRNQTG
jgi:hypothetical protein